MRAGRNVALVGVWMLSGCALLEPEGPGWSTQTSCPGDGKQRASLSSGRANIQKDGPDGKSGRYSDSRGRDGDVRAQFAGSGMSTVVNWDDGGRLTTTFARDDDENVFTGLDSEGCIAVLRLRQMAPN